MIEEPLGGKPLTVIAQPVRQVQGRLPAVRMPLKIKITLPYLLLAVVLAIGASYLVSRIVFDSIDERFHNQLAESGKLASQGMVRQERELLDTLRLLAYGDGISAALQVQDAERLRELAFGITMQSQVEAVVFLDAAGKRVFSMQHIPGGNIEEYEYLTGGEEDYSQHDFVHKVLGRETDQLVNEAADKFAGVIHSDQGDYVYVAGPIPDAQGNLAGVILVGRRVNSLAENIREQTNAHVTLYNPAGKPLASTFILSPELDPEQARQVLEQAEENVLKPRALIISSIEYGEILTSWQVRQDLTLGVLGIALPKTLWVSTSRLTRIQLSLLIGSAFAMVIVMGLNVSSRIARPISELVQASLQVSQGDLSVQVPARSNDEVAVLAESFNQMVQKIYQSKEELIDAYDSTLIGWARALAYRDEETEEHTMRVTDVSVALARVMGFSDEELVHVRRGALLHDIGKIGVPDSILRKPGPLTDDEWVLMRMHPEIAYRMLEPIAYLKDSLNIPYYHHERWDGSGYPFGFEGEEIPLEARIFAIVDVWDALRSDRPYRSALPEEVVFKYIEENNGKLFDPAVVEAFFELMRKQEPGQDL
jgi:putative nucleotidyltransferase with HDIG domain